MTTGMTMGKTRDSRKGKGWLGPALAVAVLAAGAVGGVQAGGYGMGTQCRWCGSTSHGGGCPYGPTGKHEHRGTGRECEWCGSTSYGGGCPYSPTGKHRHGGGQGCRWCGSGSYGGGCPYGPSGKHEH